MTAQRISAQDIQAAARTLEGSIINTPCPPSQTLSRIAGADLVLKFENLQITSSFKERGALIKLLSLTPDQRAAGVIAMSAGNHAQAVAYHAQRLDIPAVIVMPKFTPNVKVEHTREFGAEVILQGETLFETRQVTEQLVHERNLLLVHPYDDPMIITGQGTVALEMLTAHPDLEVLLVPIGGGGLIAGTAIAAGAFRPRPTIIGVQVARFPSMKQALRGEPIECGASTLAEGIAVKSPGRLTLPIIRDQVEDILLVDEEDVEEAVRLLLEVEKTVVEGAGAVGLAAVLKQPDRFAGRKVGLILSGGNIDLLILSSIIQRGLVHSGRLVQLRVQVRDVPGSLAAVSRVIADAEANVVEVHHQRAFTHVPLESAEVDLILQTRGIDHVRDVIERLTRAGYPTRRIEYGAPG